MKTLPKALAMLLLFLLAAACQNGSEEAPASTNAPAPSTSAGAASAPAEDAAGAEPAASEAKIELDFWYAYGSSTGEANENLVKQFNESQDEIVVTAHFQGSNYSDLHAKLQAAVAANNAPDVTVIESYYTGPFAEAGMLQDLTESAERDPTDFDDFIPSMLGNSYVDGKLYSMPYMKSTNMLYMNATLLKEAGLDPNGPETWDELAEYAAALNVPGERYGITVPLDLSRFEAFLEASGGAMISEDGKKALFNAPEGVGILEFWLGLYRDGAAELPTGDARSDVSKQNFSNQKAAMFIQSSSHIASLTEAAKAAGFELTAAVMPKKATHGSTALGSNLAVLSGLPEEKRQAAWTFVKWMTDTRQTAFASAATGYQPTRYSAIDSPEMQAIFAENQLFRVAAEQMDHAVSRPMVLPYNEIGKLITNQIERVVLTPSLSPKEALDQAAAEADALLNK